MPLAKLCGNRLAAYSKQEESRKKVIIEQEATLVAAFGSGQFP